MQGRHRFCATCGCAPFGDGDVPEVGGAFVSINLGTLDDASDAELAEAPVNYGNGRDNKWWEAPAETRHL